jgi:hypothetical protein
MAKKDVFERAVNAGAVPSDANPDDFTLEQLNNLLSGDVPAWEGSLSAREPIVAPDGHVTLSQEDIDRARAQ